MPHCQNRTCEWEASGRIRGSGSTCCGHEVIDVFDDIDEGFVAAVFYVAAAVGHCSSGLYCNP